MFRSLRFFNRSVKALALSGLVAYVLAISACSHGGGPTSPTSAGPVDGMVTFTYVRNFACSYLCDRPVRLADDGWGPVYSTLIWDPVFVGSKISPPMELQPDGSWTYIVRVPANKRLGIFVLDPSIGINQERTATGMSADGVRLIDSSYSAMFTFRPPDTIIP
jgi:hypothetical protein